ncbi:Ubiquitin-like protein [Friedmanniomyces endolithicus]|uniref:Ubiquitin-like protein ATG12 n=1 Tax=Friedmanniomyces endolithicus TaxID=329885 RepID=A0AAN6JF83_9PEZI|nr:Ubiquitin-like protein [Friedmanniomyces endolithicus]KAK0300746.1 Ubiquitin-like protein [Friedmanniomyces endolithicus]KAK0327559.1 Ubiquitin-like protein [Friedmanniomyces endolithicus]KAK1018047.1 Ubiquitin-like protein [Friedmanniomyces endolithicus]
MASSSGAPSPPDTGLEVDVDDNAADMPLTMAASVVLDHLPKDAHRALEIAGELEQDKVTIRLSPLPNTPQLRQPRFKCSSNQRFEHIVRFLRKKVGLEDHESVFCYVNSVFSPGLDEGVGNLWRCFKTGNELVVNYSITQAFG